MSQTRKRSEKKEVQHAMIDRKTNDRPDEKAPETNRKTDSEPYGS